MGLTRILLAWLAVGGWLLAWEAVARAVGPDGGPRLRPPLWRFAVEALLLTLLGALWFGSLGSGSWWLVFGLVGALRDWPGAPEGRKSRPRVSRELGARLLGVLRTVVAGGVLAWRISPS